MKKMSNSDTKAKILEAYNDLINEAESRNKENIALQKQLQQKEKELKKADNVLSSDIVEVISTIKSNFNNALDDFERAYVSEKENLAIIRSSIKQEKDELENLYKIKTRTESLDALIATHNLTKEKLELEIQDQKESWKREKEAFEYDQKIQRRNDEQEYLDKKKALDKELKLKSEEFNLMKSEKENEWALKEEEYNRLKSEAASFELNLNEKINQVREELTASLTKEFEHKKALENKDMELQIKLYQQEINIMKAKIKEFEGLVKEYKSSSELASTQVKDIAMKAIESSSINRSSWNEKRQENNID